MSSYFTNQVLRFEAGIPALTLGLTLTEAPNPNPDGKAGTGRPLGALGEGNGTVGGPVGVSVGAGGHIYVAAHRQDTVVSFDGASLEYQGVFAGGGVLQGPSGIAFSSDQTLFVASHLNDMIARFNGTTGVPWSFGSGQEGQRKLVGRE